METVKNFLSKVIRLVRGFFVTKQKHAKGNDIVCITNYDEHGSDVNSRLIEPRDIDSDSQSVLELSAGNLDKRFNSCEYSGRAIRLENDHHQQYDQGLNQQLLLENFAYDGPDGMMDIFSVNDDHSDETGGRLAGLLPGNFGVSIFTGQLVFNESLDAMQEVRQDGGDERLLTLQPSDFTDSHFANFREHFTNASTFGISGGGRLLSGLQPDNFGVSIFTGQLVFNESLDAMQEVRQDGGGERLLTLQSSGIANFSEHFTDASTREGIGGGRLLSGLQPDNFGVSIFTGQLVFNESLDTMQEVRQDGGGGERLLTLQPSDFTDSRFANFREHFTNASTLEISDGGGGGLLSGLQPGNFGVSIFTGQLVFNESTDTMQEVRQDGGDERLITLQPFNGSRFREHFTNDSTFESGGRLAGLQPDNFGVSIFTGQLVFNESTDTMQEVRQDGGGERLLTLQPNGFSDSRIANFRERMNFSYGRRR